MADNLALRGTSDRKRINLSEKHEVAYWTKKFGVTTEQLKAVVDKVGSMA